MTAIQFIPEGSKENSPPHRGGTRFTYRIASRRDSRNTTRRSLRPYRTKDAPGHLHNHRWKRWAIFQRSLPGSTNRFYLRDDTHSDRTRKSGSVDFRDWGLSIRAQYTRL